jgi:hypothetical protein
MRKKAEALSLLEEGKIVLKWSQEKCMKIINEDNRQVVVDKR